MEDLDIILRVGSFLVTSGILIQLVRLMHWKWDTGKRIVDLETMDGKVIKELKLLSQTIENKERANHTSRGEIYKRLGTLETDVGITKAILERMETSGRSICPHSASAV